MRTNLMSGRLIGRLLLSVLLTELATAAPWRFSQSGFSAGPDGRPADWSTWSARPETFPRCFVDHVHSRGEPGSLGISGNSNAVEHGGWEHTVRGIESGSWYRFTAYYRSNGVAAENWQIIARLDWLMQNGKRAGEPDYAYQARREAEWTRVMLETQAPPKATAVKLELYLSDAPLATVWWDDVSLEQIPAPPPQPVTIAAINLRPEGTGSSAQSVQQFINTVEQAVKAKADVILLPEGITVVGTGKTYVDVAETIPGPTTEKLAALARKMHAHVAAGIYEREGTGIYNTAVLLDRTGTVIGKYRKVYLPREEVEGGLTPGNAYPVFRTDFGRIGMMICYDVFYSDPARALAIKGAEMILMPIWGGEQNLGKARAIENRVFLVSSGYDYPTYVMDPDGELLSLASQRGTAAIATIDLNKRYLHPHRGDMRQRRMKEMRLDVALGEPEFSNPVK